MSSTDGPSLRPAAGAGTVSRWLRCRLVLDRVVAAMLAAVSAPVVALLAWAVRREDGQAPLITVPRVGVGGRVFGMWKLRSMRVDTPDGRAAGTPLTGGDDPRITAIGRRMRALHLDELPQLYNVVRGEMALLGPRPEAPEFVDVHDGGWQRVLQVPPGIAGPTQLIVGDWERSRIDLDTTGDAYVRSVVPVKVALDGWYVTGATPALDALTLVGLCRHLLPGGELRRLVDRVSQEVPDAAGPIAGLRR